MESGHLFFFLPQLWVRISFHMINDFFFLFFSFQEIMSSYFLYIILSCCFSFWFVWIIYKLRQLTLLLIPLVYFFNILFFLWLYVWYFSSCKLVLNYIIKCIHSLWIFMFCLVRPQAALQHLSIFDWVQTATDFSALCSFWNLCACLQPPSNSKILPESCLDTCHLGVDQGPTDNFYIDFLGFFFAASPLWDPGPKYHIP